MPSSVRPLIQESWQRSLAFHVDPDVPAPPVVFAEDQLADTREAHPLSSVMSLVRRLLVDDASDAGVIVAVSDADAQLLWVEGDANLLRQAESIRLVHGSVWSEGAAGTNADRKSVV